MTMPIYAYELHPIVRYVRSLDGEFYLRREVAGQLGVSITALRVIADSHPELDLGPTHTVRYGALTIELYTPERVAQLRAHFAQPRPPRKSDGRPRQAVGRRRIWTTAEAQERTRAQDRARKRLALARRQRDAGMHELAADNIARAEKIMAELAAQHATRMIEAEAPRRGDLAFIQE